MLNIDDKGVISDPRILNSISSNIEHGAMPVVQGIIVHQTDSPTAKSTFNSYSNPKANGAHFLIDKDGTIYQTASVTRKTYHVGQLRSRCLAEMTCEPAELKLAKKWNPKGENIRERAKNVPNRFPSNDDSIGIELVGKSYPNPDKADVKNEPVIYEVVTPEQNASLKWLVGELREALKVPLTEIYRHPVVSHKTKSEARTASW